MTRQTRSTWCLLLAMVMGITGCHPQQPFFFHEDGDLSHYVNVSTDIEFPDVTEPSLAEVTHAQRPLSLRNMEDYQIVDLTLEEVTRITLRNSQVMRQLGGLVATGAPETISRNMINAAAVTTTYDVALMETGSGYSFGTPFDGQGVESALSEFDAQLNSSITWQKNDRPVNFTGFNFFANELSQDLGNFNAAISKTNVTGGTWGFQNNTLYDSNNNGNRIATSQWETNFEAFFSQPLLQGLGMQYNRIAGPYSFQQYAANAPASFDGVVIARIRTDQTLADFEGGVRNLMRDVEQSYWELYFAYRDLDARKQGLASAQETWKNVAARYRAQAVQGSADREAQSRAQYYQFKAQVEQSLTNLFRAESRLRYIMGLSVADGRLFRPADEPTTARLEFDWAGAHAEAQARRVEIRRQKWTLKRRELELIAARNHLLPRLDAVGRYRWLGAGDDLIGYDGGPLFTEGTSAFENLTTGNYQEWELGLQMAMPLGFRRQMDTVRHAQLLLARERALMQDLELEISHQLGEAVRNLESNFTVTQTFFNGRVAAQREVAAVQQAYEVGTVTLDLVLDAQRRRAEAESAYYRSLVDYNLSILDVHYRKGSLLDFNGVHLAEGSWPGKAYFDALRRARQRDASMYLDYGYTRPNVMSRGTYDQHGGIEYGTGAGGEVMFQGLEPTPATPVQPQEDLPEAGMDMSYLPLPPANNPVIQASYQQPVASATMPVEGRLPQPVSLPAVERVHHHAA